MFAGSPAWTIDTAKTLRDLDVPTLIVTRRAYDLYAARKAGLRCEAADFLSEYATEDMDLAGIASMVACTPDDDTNSIASVHYRRALGRANVFQLERMDESDDGDATTGTAQILKARTAFDPRPRTRRWTKCGVMASGYDGSSWTRTATGKSSERPCRTLW